MWNLLEEHLTRVYRFALRLARDPHRAEDVAQEAFLRAWRERGRLRDPQAARVWLFRIAANVWRDQVRKNRLEEAAMTTLAIAPGAAAAAAPPPERLLAERDEIHRALLAMDALPPRQRQTLYLHAIEGLSHEEIHEVLGISPEAVKASLSLARRTMRGLFAGGDRVREGAG